MKEELTILVDITDAGMDLPVSIICEGCGDKFLKCNCRSDSPIQQSITWEQFMEHMIGVNK